MSGYFSGLTFNNSKYIRMLKPSSVKLQVTIIKQGKQYVAYTPALDLSTSGKDLKQVQKRFAELIDIFFEELIEQNTFEEVLSNLGWVK